jgi:hypothetical protein
MPPIAFRSLIRVASWIVPWRARPAWHARWASGLRDWWILVERGELIRGAAPQMARTIRVAFVDAFWLRFNKAYLAYWVRSPGFLLLCASCALALTAAFTRGFAVTRTLIDMAAGHPAQRILSTEGPTGTLIAYTVPIVFALAAGVVLAAIRRLSLRRYGWRYACFLAVKTASVLVLVSLLWIEGGTVIRAHIHNGPLRILGGALGLTLVFVFVFGYAFVWSFDDQRRRCPVCLRRLTMPVTIGLWGSVFEPAITELLCDDGHGALALCEGQPGQWDRWTALDESWRELFDRAHAGASKE